MEGGLPWNQDHPSSHNPPLHVRLLVSLPELSQIPSSVSKLGNTN